MTRAERRAAAHAARKAARKAGFPQPENPPTPAPAPVVESTPAPQPEKTISDAQLAANRLNAQKSHGPVTPEGKAKVGRNAITHNLTGNQILIPSGDMPRYEALIADYQAQFQPVGPEETYLLQSIIDIRWRLAALPAYEAALLDLGRVEMIQKEPGLANNPQPVLDLQVRLYLEKNFRNLALQEGRLARRREREMKELREMQATRKAAEAKANEEQPKTAPTPKPDGIVFTIAEIGPFVAQLTPELRENFMDALLMAGLPTEERLEATA